MKYFYLLLLKKPLSCPLMAISLIQMRHMSKYLMYPWGLPQSLHLRTNLVEYLGFFRDLIIRAFLAILFEKGCPNFYYLQDNDYLSNFNL